VSDIIRELREDYPAVDVTTVVFSRDFAGVGCCVIPQDRVLAIIGDVEALVKALEWYAKGGSNWDRGKCAREALTRTAAQGKGDEDV
jgi:hypothetical protein